MKAEVQKQGILSKATSVLTYNWGLKLLALLLAILVYYSIKTERAQVLGVHARDNGISIPKGEATTDGNQK